jgi:hypothetical protein
MVILHYWRKKQTVDSLLGACYVCSMFIKYLPYNWKTEKFLVKTSNPFTCATSRNKEDAWWFISQLSSDAWCDEQNAIEGNRHWVTMRSIECAPQENNRIAFQRNVKGGQ